MLTAEFRSRLAKVAGLATSCNPHEAQAAIGRMVALCEKEGVSLTDIIAPQPNELAAKVANTAKTARANYGPRRAELMLGHQRTAGRLLASNIHWSERERDFLESMLSKRSSPTVRQESWIKDLDRKAKSNRPLGGWQ